VALHAAPAVSQTADQPINIVAAENFYGDVARQIGDADVAVTSILSNPDQDPHLFEVTPSVGRDVSAARILIYNGIDYDPWMVKLLGAARSSNRRTIVVADLVGRKTGDNPHIWYDPTTMLALATALADVLSAEDPANKAAYDERRARFGESMKPIEAQIAVLRRRFLGRQVTATEPIFDCLFGALGLHVRNRPFQLAVMNNTEPSASEVAAFENDLKTHQVELLVYNSQATSPATNRMVKLARQSHIPTIAAAETLPAGKDYQGWMLSNLQAVDRALSKRTP
jgi:zinc/manganese transport system substrate-binding protein